MAAASLIGSAIGASAEGAGLGFAAGATTGLVLWGMRPDVGPAGAVRWSLVGLAIGGLADWVAAAGGTDMGALPLACSIRR